MLTKTFQGFFVCTKSQSHIARYLFCSYDNDKTEASSQFAKLLENNRKWASKCIEEDKEYFSSLVGIQKPDYLWIGCADSRVPANQILGLKPGQVFVHRNIANVVPPNDINVLAVVQYAVQFLKVKHIIVTGHYGCGGIKAVFNQNDFGPLEAWLSYVRDLRSRYRHQLMGSQEQQQNDLVELNVKRQVLNVARIPSVQRAWKQGSQLHLHGLVYNLADGILNDLGIEINSLEQVPSEFRIFPTDSGSQQRN